MQNKIKGWSVVFAGNNVPSDSSPNVGQQIDALVAYFTGQLLGAYTLERALEKVKANDAKIKAYTKSLLSKEEEVVLQCELCAVTFSGEDAHPQGTNVCPACMKGQMEGFQ